MANLIQTSTIFDSAIQEPAPKTVDECTTPDKLIYTLWSWAKNVEKYGQVLLIIIILAGIINAWNSSQIVSNALRADTEFSPIVFLSLFLQTISYALIEYLIYHIIALLVASLAKIVYNTRATARIAEFQARQQEKEE